MSSLAIIPYNKKKVTHFIIISRVRQSGHRVFYEKFIDY